MDRHEFLSIQLAAGDQWFENAKRVHPNWEAYIGLRQCAYLDRWREAVRFTKPRSRLLDLGGGNLYPLLLGFLRDLEIDYHYLDADPSAVAGSKTLAVEFGFDTHKFTVGFNDVLPFSDNYFDDIFSSHCIEHSLDITTTLAEIWRVLKPGGNLLMAVPLGWELNPMHPYFFGPTEWVSLVEDAGFAIRVAQIGTEYPEEGHDLFIAARRKDERAPSMRIDPSDYNKENYRRLTFDDPNIIYKGDVVLTEDRAICQDNWSIAITLTGNPTYILPLLWRHDWSGIVTISCGQNEVVEDLYSWFKFVQPRILNAETGPGLDSCKIRPIGKNVNSYSSEAVLAGVLLR